MDNFFVHVRVVNGRLDFTEEQKKRLHNYLEYYNDKVVVFSLAPAPKEISSSLRKTYFGVWIPAILDHIGLEVNKENKAEIHKELMLRFNPKIDQNIFGETIKVPGSLKDLSQNEFLEVIEKIDHWFGTTFKESLPEPKKQ